MTYSSNKPVLDDVTIVIPTVGRSLLLRCLNSIMRGDTWPAEILIIDQGSDHRVSHWVASLRKSGIAVRHIPSSQRGTAAATNRGIENAKTSYVAVTHDDCEVAEDWLRKLAKLASQTPRTIVTGMVIPEKGKTVPSVITTPDPIIYRRPLLNRDPLFPANMAFSLQVPEEIGPFDEYSPLPQAEDAEWSYRALRAGIAIHYVPEAKVYHIAWRDFNERQITYRNYVRSLGGFYGIYIRRCDYFIFVRFLYDLLRGPWVILKAWRNSDPELKMIGRAYLTQLLPGVISGFRFKRSL